MDHELEKQLQEHQDKNYVFGSTQYENLIIVCEKPSDAITNESMKSIFDIDHAYLRANKMKVIDVLHKFGKGKTVDVKQLESTQNTILDSDFDPILNKICSTGIHYFKTFEPAFYSNLMRLEKGVLKRWYYCGRKMFEKEYNNGFLNGKCTVWHINGQKKSEGKCKNGLRYGLWANWYKNGRKSSMGEYMDLRREGKWICWYNNGLKKSAGQYQDGYKQGKWHYWYRNGEKSSMCQYEDECIMGKLIEWNTNGKRKLKKAIPEDCKKT